MSQYMTDRKGYLLNVAKLALTLEADIARLKNALLAESYDGCEFTIIDIKNAVARYEKAAP